MASCLRVPTNSAPTRKKSSRKRRSLLEQNELQAALQCIWSLVTRANQYVDQTAPFKLAKDPAQAARLDEVLYNLAEICRILGILVQPFLPDDGIKDFCPIGPDRNAGQV